MIGNDSLIRTFAPSSPLEVREESPRSSQTERPAEPRPSFFRGVIIALAVALPVWAWVIMSSIR
jgi:hypothetical protein